MVERKRQMDGRTKMLFQMRVKKWLCKKNGVIVKIMTNMFHKMQRSRFIMYPNTGKHKLLCGVNAYEATGGNDSQYYGSLVAAVN